MSWHRENHTVSIVGGAGSFVSDHPWRGLLWNLIVEPDTSTNEYALIVTDEKGDKAISFGTAVGLPQVGNLNSALEMPVRGKYTFTFSGATIDEDINVRTACNDTVNY